MAFIINQNASGMQCTAGEPIVFGKQFRDTAGNVESLTDREFFLQFYTAARKDLGRYEASIETDATGNYMYWALKGDVSEALLPYSPCLWAVAEDLDGGIDIIRTGRFTIDMGPPLLENSNIAPIALYALRITRTNDIANVITSPSFTVTTLPYSPITPPAVSAPVFTGTPQITGTATVGQTLTATDGTILNGAASARQWLRGGVPISGATGSSYTLVSADSGALVSFRVTATGSGGSTSATSLARTVATVPVAVTIDNTASNSSLLPTQVEGAHELFLARDARLKALEIAAAS